MKCSAIKFSTNIKAQGSTTKIKNPPENPKYHISKLDSYYQFYNSTVAFQSRPNLINLIFPPQLQVELACGLLSNRCTDLMALPVYAALPFESQCQIFNGAVPGTRKVVVATNIAETSITIDGILYVVDMGLFKESIYDKGIDTLKVIFF